MKKHPILAGALMGVVVVGVATLGGCAVYETATVSSEPDGSVKQRIVSNSGFLSANLVIEDTKMGQAGNLLRVQATIKNQSSGDINFQYKFKWLDKDDFEVAIDGRPWQPLTITGYESKSVQAVAPNPTATSFQILVQD
ncbi:hypothetical protein A3742_14745 [Oleiphilus sp. HI0071]|jgi:uncharacterized protein YcfL|uniref:YcfL family protein n=1 Tax=unclassified Oleiphilus TaxID=2631174 RepID=UPI0007C3CFB6|nr:MULTISPECIES: YcfL family protein [unclassified Oleiphilus]KZY64692.1 hypothetical protein A3737_13900 [Oleiphilus sp. HI0065]KZY79184.1 hypothetical protein A3742_14745 [Oleiphilus sp. HI0071]KZZ04957.1 hypothetical protein A3744_09895 [Oleiphilus sp. HI0073]KZZ43722.1 hypothetical protein A3758_03775 [Oleiphilus sp. HI0118]KZZ55091.1 hypothetical protein A3760_08915 [Oleiphilus sp. HI0122]KZZ78023.1 hypothetical protein A3765_08560 [Oleiphilus sp. HI0130]KZZ80963.1 hypothetical protein 